jgi:predicted HTH transcriptional regulator
MSLQNYIQSGESKNIEFKEELPNSSAIAKTVIAFSNTVGSKLSQGLARTPRGKQNMSKRKPEGHQSWNS